MKPPGSILFPTPVGDRGAGPLPVKVRTMDGELVGTGVSGSPIDTAPGRYFVSVVMPDGRERGSGAIVEVQSGVENALPPMAGSAAVPPPAPVARMTVPPADFGFVSDDAPFAAPPDSEAQAVSRGMPERAPAPEGQTWPARLWCGDWFAAWDGPTLAAAGRAVPDLAPGLDDTLTLGTEAPVILGASTCQDRLLAMRIGAVTRYALVPYDECIACIGETPNPREIAARLVIGAGGPAVRFRSSLAEEANTLLSFVENGVLTEMWTVSEDMINQGERAMYGSGSSILRAVTGAYVLLRANHLDGLDAWLRSLDAAAPTLPDIDILRVEMLARLGMHDDALALLKGAIAGQCPWFRSGLSYMIERVRLYIDVSANTDVTFRIADADLPQFLEARDRLDRLMRVLVRGQVMTTFDIPD